MIKTFVIKPGDHLTDEQIREIEEAAKYPIVPDEDCEELSMALMEAFKGSVAQENRRKKA